MNDKELDEADVLKSLPKEERRELEEEKVLNFIHFAISEDNWREEIETGRKYQKAIKENSPEIYKEMIKEE